LIRRVPIALATAILALSIPAAALAAVPEQALRQVSVTAVPGTLAVTVSPIPVLLTNASETEGTIRVDNISTLIEDVTIEVMDYTIDASGRPVAAPADFAFGSATWYRFEVTEFTLPSGMSRDVPFELAIPPDAGAGDHFAALRVIVQAHEGEVQAAPDGASARSVLVIESRLQHRIAGARPQTPTVDLGADPGWSAVQFTAAVGNAGNTVVGHQAAPTPVLTLYSLMPWADPAVAERTIPVRGFYVAPESVRDVAMAWTDPPIIGRYRAVFVLPAADGQPQVIAETTFTVVHLPILVAIALALLSGMLAIAWMIRRRSGRTSKLAAMTALTPS
jgi:hypothetical protein